VLNARSNERAFLLPSPGEVKNTCYTLVVVATVATLAFAVSVRADRTDFRVNDDNAQVEHSHPRIAAAEGLGFAIVWSDLRNGQNDIFIQRFTPTGQPVGSNSRVNDDSALAHQSGPALAVDLAGKYSVVWQDYRNGVYPFDPGIFFQRYDTSLDPLGLNRNLTTERPDTLKENPDIDLSPWGTGVIVWADYRNRNWDIYGQLISSTGTLIGSNFKVNDDVGSTQQHAPRISTSSEGWFVVAWYDNRVGNDDIFAQRFDSAGQKLGANVRVNSDNTVSRQAFPDIAADGSGHFTVVWVDWRNGVYPANPDIFARRFDRLMQPLTADKKVNTDGSARAQREPSIAADRMGNVAIIWSDSAGSSWDIVGQMIDVDGVVREPNFRANLLGDSAQLQPDAALDGRYRYVTWADRRNGRYDVYASITKYNDPSLAATPATLSLRMDISDTGVSLPLVINHVGYNRIDYQISSSHAWLTTSPSTGSTPDTVTVSITPGQSYGTHYGSLTLIDLLRRDSSVTVPVRLDVTAPLLSLAVDTIRLQGTARGADTVQYRMVIGNAGSGRLSWNAGSDSSWIWLSRSSGDEADTVMIGALASLLDTGSYTAPIVFTSLEAVNSPETVAVMLELIPPGVDTITLGSTQCRMQAPFELPVTLTATSPIMGIYLPISFDPAWLRIDSVRRSPVVPAGMSLLTTCDTVSGTAVVALSGGADDAILSGTGQIATIFGTAQSREGITYLEAGQGDTLTPSVIHLNGTRYSVTVNAGEIAIGDQTDVAESPTEIPHKLILSQNHPNPFNAGTVIEFELPSPGQAKLEIFNVLGQKVAEPLTRSLTAGTHVTSWDGLTKNGRQAPSGIYFYRLQTPGGSLVRKMVLVK